MSKNTNRPRYLIRGGEDVERVLIFIKMMISLQFPTLLLAPTQTLTYGIISTVII
jgi:hypothetical protein